MQGNTSDISEEVVRDYIESGSSWVAASPYGWPVQYCVRLHLPWYEDFPFRVTSRARSDEGSLGYECVNIYEGERHLVLVESTLFRYFPGMFPKKLVVF